MRNIVLTCCLIWFAEGFAASTEAVYGENGMVSSSSTLASQAGIEIMQQGGNAVDGAVATAFALAVTHPSAGNIGGGGFAVIRLPDGRVLTQDHREKAPGRAHRDMYLDENGDVIAGLSRETLLASGVPGSVAGLLDLLEDHGSMSRQAVMAPAIKLAKDGFELSYFLARHINVYFAHFSRHPASLAKFSKNGEPLAAGNTWIQSDLASTLMRISEQGSDGFYTGETAALIVAEMQRGEGIISHEDLANYQPVWRDPVKGSYRGYDIWGMGPPSSGGAMVIQMLNMLEPYEVAAMGWGSANLAHLMVEAERRAYADRAEHLGDPDFYDIPLAMLIDKDYAKVRLADFNPDKASSSNTIYPGQALPAESRETTHFSVMDKSGMMVAFTTTLNSAFGNKIVVPGTGILLNNEMDDFSVKVGEANQFALLGRKANAIVAGKRMLSSMSPTIVTRDGGPLLITGSPGGSTIITTTLQVILNLVDHGMTLEDAVSLPRFHHQWKPDSIFHEKYVFSPDTLRALKAKGHENFVQSRFGRGIGDANSILFKDGMMHGVKDPRSAGVAVGF